MFVSASTRCFLDQPFFQACEILTDLEYDKIEIWMDEAGSHLKPSTVAADPDAFFAKYRESTRLAPAAFCFGSDVPPAQFAPLSRLAKLMRITQITMQSSPRGTPFNAEIDRFKELIKIANQDGVRISTTTHTGLLAEDPRTAVELCQATPGLGLTLDPSYFICGPFRGASMEQVYPFVYHVHLRDTSPEQLQVRIGLGEIDYSRLISQLERHHYNRALSVDLFPNLIEGDQRPIELRKMRLLLESLL